MNIKTPRVWFSYICLFTFLFKTFSDPLTHNIKQITVATFLSWPFLLSYEIKMSNTAYKLEKIHTVLSGHLHIKPSAKKAEHTT